MNANIKPKISSQDLADQITKHIEELAKATDTARVSDAMLQYLEMCSKFHRYSWCNTWLILMSCPQATQVAGFRKWQSLNRYVRKGEHGIPILAPILIKEKDNEHSQGSDTQSRFLSGFKVVYVFDISQTDGKPLPESPSWSSREKNSELQERLITFARERSINVTEVALLGNVQGISKGGLIEISPSAGTSTLIHEIAHELLHKQAEQWTMNREEKELEAEAVSFVVGKYFGLEVSTAANYIAMWRGGRDAILEHMERIQKAAGEIISTISNKP